MKLAHVFYECTPQIVPAHQQTEITIRPLYDHVAFPAGAQFQVTLIPIRGIDQQTNRQDRSPEPVTLTDGCIKLKLQFEGEQEYILLLQQNPNGKNSAKAEFRIYALEPDLFARRPYKGDTHMHTFRSDGKESPGFLTASCRKIGMDFMAITDHRQYGPSLEAMKAFEGLDIDLKIFPGEEVHPPENPVHIVNFGGGFSVNALFATDAYKDEVAKIETELDKVPAGVSRYELASCTWCFNKIREGGGLAVFCHPYWQAGTRLDVPEYLTDLIFEHQPYDALELIGGYLSSEVESNMLQVARYHDERAKGRRIPIVGASDSHGCVQSELFGWYYTIVFAKSLELPELVGGVRDLYSVAVEGLPNEQVRAFGPFRLVRYAQFLLREIFPKHDEICVEEGRLMLAHVAGDAEAAASLRALKGRVSRLYDRLWAAS
ncbi:MAG: PHP domain-containing protein [Armatimonadota bacterium]